MNQERNQPPKSSFSAGKFIMLSGIIILLITALLFWAAAWLLDKVNRFGKPG